MSFTYNDAVPATNNDPSFDQPDMLQNTISAKQIWAVDHLTFDSNSAGTHKQTAFHQFATPTAPTGTGSVAYPAAGVADTGHPQYYFRQELATFMLSAIRAFGSFYFTNGATTFINSYNCASLTVTTSPRLATITLNPNSTTGTSFVVIPFITSNNQITYSITGASTFTLTTGAGGVGEIVSFIVLQA